MPHYKIPEADFEEFQVDASQVTRFDVLDKHVETAKDYVCRRLKVLEQTKQAKKDIVDGFKEPLKVQKEELDSAMDQLSTLEDRRMVLASGSGE